MQIIVNGIDVSSYLTSFEVLDEIEEGYLLGNATCTQVAMEFNNRGGELDGLADYPFIVDGKYYYVFDKPERYTGQLSINAFDSMVKFNSNYATELSYPNTIQQQLEELSILSGVEVDYSGLPYELINSETSFYDSTIIMREYLEWIAEASGMNAYIDDSNIVRFRELATNSYIATTATNFEIEGLINITRVYYEDGVRQFVSGETDGNTLYIRPSNPYITQSLVNLIHSKYNGLTFYAFSSLNIKGIDGLKLTDLITYRNATMMVLSLNFRYFGSTYPIQSLEGKAKIKQAEDVIVRVDQSIRIRRIQTIMDQTTTELKTIAVRVDEDHNQLVVVTQNLEGITQFVRDGDNSLESRVSATEQKTVILSEDPNNPGMFLSNDMRFSKDGLAFTHSDSSVTTTINNEGLTINNFSTELLRVDQDGVNAENLTARTYLVVGNNSRFEDYYDEEENADGGALFDI